MKRLLLLLLIGGATAMNEEVVSCDNQIFYRELHSQFINQVLVNDELYSPPRITVGTEDCDCCSHTVSGKDYHGRSADGEGGTRMMVAEVDVNEISKGGKKLKFVK